MTSLAVHRPLRARLGERGAHLAAFVVSGVLHEVAISLPVRAGYGLPTLYFALQGLLAWHAGGRLPRVVGLLGIVLPLPLVFHPWFVSGVLVPLLG
jgi:alginate O-acetyltransferase complex protein AlgI